MTNYSSHLFVIKLFNKKDLNVHFIVISQTDERLGSITYGRLRL